MAQKIGIPYSDKLTLPNYRSMEELHEPQFAKNYTLDGTLYVDHTGTSRSGWELTYDILTKAEYEAIRAKYDLQFSTDSFLRFEDDELGINKDVFLNMPDSRNVVWNRGFVEGLTITLEAEEAD